MTRDEVSKILQITKIVSYQAIKDLEWIVAHILVVLRNLNLITYQTLVS